MTASGGFGTKLKIMVGTTLTAVAGLKDVTFPEQAKMLFESTAHPTSGATGYATYGDTGKRQLTEFTATLFWDVDEATHAALLTAFDSTTALSMSIEDPAGDEVIAFSGHIRRIGRISSQEDGYQAEVSIQPTGAPTIT